MYIEGVQSVSFCYIFTVIVLYKTYDSKNMTVNIWQASCDKSHVTKTHSFKYSAIEELPRVIAKTQ